MYHLINLGPTYIIKISQATIFCFTKNLIYLFSFFGVVREILSTEKPIFVGELEKN